MACLQGSSVSNRIFQQLWYLKLYCSNSYGYNMITKLPKKSEKLFSTDIVRVC